MDEERKNQEARDEKENWEKEFRRDELVARIERSVERMTLRQLEALYYDMMTKNLIEE